MRIVLKQFLQVSVCLLILLWNHTQPAQATNIAFMPGDAFFSSYLRQKDLTAFTADKSATVIKLKYGYGPQGDFGGYAGFEILELSGNTSETIKALQFAYQELRKNYPRDLRETFEKDGTKTLLELNSCHMLIYNKDIDLSKIMLWNRYNENWMKLPDEAYGSTDPAIKYSDALLRSRKTYPFYHNHIHTQKAIIDDWKNAAKVAPFNAKIPTNKAWAVSGPPNRNTPIVADLKDIMIIVMPGFSAKEANEERAWMPFFIIRNGKIERHKFSHQEDKIVIEIIDLKELDLSEIEKIQRQPPKEKRDT